MLYIYIAVKLKNHLFQQGRGLIKDDEHPEAGYTVVTEENITKIKQLATVDRSISIKQIEDKVKISKVLTKPCNII